MERGAAAVAHPLAGTAESVSRYLPSGALVFGRPDPGSHWMRCVDVDRSYISEWETATEQRLVEEHGASHPMTAAGYVLSWYARMPGLIGGLCFGVCKRVPRLGPWDIAFTRQDNHAPGEYALLTEGFWCLEQDPDADHPDATVVDDAAQLAQILRSTVRAHADAFLRQYVPGTRLPRRHLLGAFFDGLDTGLWRAGREGVSYAQALTDAHLVLPGDVREFKDRSTLHTVVDSLQREHLTRRRLSCCYFYKLDSDREACLTCPRTAPGERAARLADS